MTVSINNSLRHKQNVQDLFQILYVHTLYFFVFPVAEPLMRGPNHKEWEKSLFKHHFSITAAF